VRALRTQRETVAMPNERDNAEFDDVDALRTTRREVVEAASASATTEEGWVGLRGVAAIKISDERVFVGGASIPSVIEFEHGSDRVHGPGMTLRVEMRDGVATLVDLRWRQGRRGGAPGVAQSDVANVNVDELIEVMVTAVSAPLRLDDTGMPLGIERVIPPLESVAKIAAGLTQMQDGPRSRYITREFLEQVAATYRDNVTGSPTKAVQEKFMVGTRTAAGYVQRARAEGLLPATTPGRKHA
jgi:hypothetical protein